MSIQSGVSVVVASYPFGWSRLTFTTVSCSARRSASVHGKARVKWRLRLSAVACFLSLSPSSDHWWFIATNPMNTETCPKCGGVFGTEVQRTRHHLLPKRFFRGSRETIDICRRCHDALERRIPFKRRLHESFYYLVVNNFLGYEAVRYDG